MNKADYMTTIISILMITSSISYSNNYRSENIDPDEKRDAELIAFASVGTQKKLNTVPISSRSRRCTRIQIIKKMLTSCCSCTSSKR